jgi:hypothetical protein
MNKLQKIVLGLAVVNMVLICLFPPFDYVSSSRSHGETFAGFAWLFEERPNYKMNSNFLQLELFVVMFNAAIGFFLLRDRPQSRVVTETRWQRIVMVGVALNLLLVLLFPPMENYHTLSRATLPSFDGFYFLFSDHGGRAIVLVMLYIEVIFVLINGAMLYLMLRRGGRD